MDAQTLNAWTRFALQKGGIGSCQALVDNPASDPEDLMFMAGENIIILRRLEKDEIISGVLNSSTSTTSKHRSMSDEETWFLGYCEGVVGKFKATLVQVHGKLKKPVLMRRSGQTGSSSDSTQQPSSRSSPATAHATSASPMAMGFNSAAERVRGERGGYEGYGAPYPAQGNAPQLGGLGISTMHIADSAPQKRTSPVREGYRRSAAEGSESDDSETLLPWARAGVVESDEEDDMNQRSISPVKGIPSAQHLRVLATRGQPRENGVSSSVESAMKSSSTHTRGTSQSSVTSESSSQEDPANRRDHVFSIYDMYGRDSVAMPNFNMKNMPGGGKGFPAGDSASTLSNNTHPTPPLPGAYRRPQQAPPITAPMSATERYSPNLSMRRPGNAPDPRAAQSSQRYGMPDHLQAGQNGGSHLMAPQKSVSAPQSPAVNNGDALDSTYNAQRRPSQQPPVNGYPMGQSGQPSSRPTSSGGRISPMGPAPPGGGFRPGQTIPAGISPGQIFRGGDQGGPHGGQQNRPDLLRRPSDPAGHLPNGYGNAYAGPHGPRQPVVKRSQTDLNPGPSEGRSTPQLRINPDAPPAPDRRSGGILSPSSAAVGLQSAHPTSNNTSLSVRTPSPLSAGDRLPSPLKSPLLMSAPGLPQPPKPVTNQKYDFKGFVLGSGMPCLPESNEARAIAEKWSAILAENDLTGARKSRKVRKLVREGIPNPMRGKSWLFLANAGIRRRVGLFEQLCKTSQEPKARKGKESMYDAIEKDVPRSLPDNRLFQDGAPGKADLEAILKAYVHYNPIIGYQQGMGMLVGIFLLHMPPEDAFWLLCALLRDIHMEGYYSRGNKQMHIDGQVLASLLMSQDRDLAQKLQGLGIEPGSFTPAWLLPLFARILPWPTLLRCWDIFFYEGPQWVLQVALALMRILRGPLMSCRSREEVIKILMRPPPQDLTPDNVINAALSVKLKDGEMRKLSRSASKLVRETRGRGSPASAGPSAGGAGGAGGPGGGIGGSSAKVGGPVGGESAPARG